MHKKNIQFVIKHTSPVKLTHIYKINMDVLFNVNRGLNSPSNMTDMDEIRIILGS